MHLKIEHNANITHHPADGATDGVGLELTVEATCDLVHLQPIL